MATDTAGSSPSRSTTAPCSDCILRKRECFRPFTDKELDFVSRFRSGELQVEPGAAILLDGHDAPHLHTVVEGLAIRIKYLPDGRRQVLNIAMPGDLIGLQSSLFGAMAHTVEALTPTRLCVFPRARLFDLYKQQAELAFDVTWLAAREEAILSEHLVNLGQRPALLRRAYLFAHLFDRAGQVGLLKGRVLNLPLTQEHLADALGLSLVHTNKTLRKLRETGCMSFDRGQLKVHAPEKLFEIAEYDPPAKRSRPFL